MTDRTTSLTAHDLRFPTSRTRGGPDAMDPDPDRSAARVVRGRGAGGHEPRAPGSSAQVTPQTTTDHVFPPGSVWRDEQRTATGVGA